jgi:hypothetical protein
MPIEFASAALLLLWVAFVGWIEFSSIKSISPLTYN